MQRIFLVFVFLVLAVSPAFAQQLVFGNPNNATADVTNENNYLVAHNEFILSYNRQRGQAN